MKFSFKSAVDSANKLLICEVCGDAYEISDIENMIDSIVNLASENGIKNIVLDGTGLNILCSNLDIVKLMVTVQENACLDGLKIARIVESELNVHNVIEDLATKLFLSIRNFETRSEAMLWLLFDKESKGH